MSAPAVPPQRWDTPAVLAVVSLVAGPFVLPVIAPAIGVTFLRSSAGWGRRAKRWGTVAGLAPCIAVAALLLCLAFFPLREPSHVLLAVLLTGGVNVVPVIAGLALMAQVWREGRRAEHAGWAGRRTRFGGVGGSR